MTCSLNWNCQMLINIVYLSACSNHNSMAPSYWWRGSLGEGGAAGGEDGVLTN